MKTIPAQEIKRRGLSFLDSDLKSGPVHVITNNQLRYVILSENQFQDLRESQNEVYLSRVKASLEDLKLGKITKGKAQKLIDELGLE